MSAEGTSSAKPETASFSDWKRLKDLANAVPTSQRTLDEYKGKFDAFFEDNSSFHEFSAQIQNATIRVRQWTANIERVRNRVRNAQHRLTVAIEEKNKQLESRNELQRRIDGLAAEIEALQSKNQTLKSSFVLLKNETIFRRRLLLDQIYRLFFIDDHLVRHFKRNCLCTTYDCIAGLHLPSIAERADHPHFQSGGAIAHLVNLLCCISRILDVPLRNPLVFRGSHSLVINRVNGRSFDFFQTLSKAPKEHGDFCLRLLVQNVVQLQADCGCLDHVAGMFDDPHFLAAAFPITRLRETLQRCVGRYRFETNGERSSNLFSCSSLIPPLPAPVESKATEAAKQFAGGKSDLLNGLPTPSAVLTNGP
ncbi:hypothetical protein M3Y99_00076400 [Aphelenchoides fujianensis]|nr:hypothetical protein M3Y99_00076400 [Aphelenchoides fujianensis]